MSMSHQTSLLFIMMLMSACGGATAPATTMPRAALITELQRLAVQVEAGALAESEEALLAGDMERANTLVQEAFPSDDIATRLFVANLLFRRNPAVSFRLHQEVAAEASDIPEVALEWAMELHRAGRCAEAVPHYRVALAERSEGPLWALLAHCLVSEGQLTEAVDAFRRSSHGRNHTEIEALFFELFGGPDAWAQRAELLRVAEVDSNRYADVVLFDLDFPIDWWNSGPNERALAHDLPRMREALPGNPLGDDLRAIVQWKTGELSDSEMSSHATRYRSALPEHLGIAAYMVEALIVGGTMTPSDALQSFSSSLNAAVARGDRAGLRLLGALLTLGGIANHEAELDRVDRIGCMQHRVPMFCGSMLLRANTSESERVLPEVENALPGHPGVETHRLLASMETGASQDALVAYLIARPRRMSSSMAWKFAFLALEQVQRTGGLNADGQRILRAALDVERGAGWSYEPWLH